MQVLHAREASGHPSSYVLPPVDQLPRGFKLGKLFGSFMGDGFNKGSNFVVNSEEYAHVVPEHVKVLELLGLRAGLRLDAPTFKHVGNERGPRGSGWH